MATLTNRVSSLLQVRSDEEYGLHFANVATRELAMAKSVEMGKPRQMFEGTHFFRTVQINNY